VRNAKQSSKLKVQKEFKGQYSIPHRIGQNSYLELGVFTLELLLSFEL
jgi:hypothetical protein